MREDIRKSDFGKRLSQDVFDAVYPILSRSCFYKELPNESTLNSYGDPLSHFMIVTRGGVKSYTYTHRGEKIFFYYFPEGSSINLLNSMASNPIAMSESVANKNTRLLCIPFNNIQTACRLIPAFESALFKLVCDYAHKQIEISILSRCKYARDRLCLYLLHQYTYQHSTSIPMHFTIESMANYLGLTRSVLSRELHNLEKEGIISLDKKEIQILDLERLKSNI